MIRLLPYVGHSAGRLTQAARLFFDQVDMARRLTMKQQRFAAFLGGAANGNQTLAARMAGYRGDDRQLAVQGSVNMRNPKIQEMMIEVLGPLLEPSMKAYAEGLVATKRRAFLTKAGAIVYTDPEPDHRIRTATANQVLDRCERSSNGYASSSDADVIPGQEDGAEPQREVADDAKTGAGVNHGIDVAQLDPADRALFEQATVIEAELAAIDREHDDGGDDHGTDH